MDVNRKIKTAIITGCTGTLGSALCAELAANSIEVYAICRPNSKRIKNIRPNKHVHLIELDVEHLEELPDILSSAEYRMNSIDAFYHFAWANTMGAGRNDMSAQIKNIQNTITAVRVASNLHCKVFIGSGSQAEYGRHGVPLRPDTPCFPENGYGMAKLCAGQMSRVECQKYGIDQIWVRILSLYGPADNKNTLISTVIDKLEDGEVPALTAGEQMWDYLYSADAAKAFRLCAEHGKNGAIYPLGSGEARPLKDYIEEIKGIINPEAEIGYGKVPYSNNQVMYLCADISELKEETGWFPSTTFKSGIKKIIERRVDI